MRPLVLVIDDEPDLRELMELLLQGSGYDVRTASDGREGLRLLEGGLRPALVLLDLMMPLVDGWQFCAAAADDPRLRAIPVVVITGAGPSSGLVALPRGAVRVLEKPVSVEVLLEVVARYATGQGG